MTPYDGAIMAAGAALAVGGAVSSAIKQPAKNTLDYPRKFVAWTLLLSCATPGALAAYQSPSAAAAALPVLSAYLLATIAGLIGAGYGYWLRYQALPTRKQWWYAAPALLAAVAWAYWITTEPSDYASCVLEKMPGVANDPAAYAVARDCRQRYGQQQDARNYQSLPASDECTAKYASLTPNRSAANMIAGACNIKFGFDISTAKPLRPFNGALDTPR